jgi:fibronectin type 3 domain-containing protein
LGQAYTITATNADACESASSSSFTIEEMLPTPDAPIIAVTAPTCTADGSASISNYDAAYTYTFDPAGPTVDGSGNIASFTLGQAYTITATNADACESASSSSFTIEEMLPTPDAPTITVTAPTCTADGSASISNYDAAYTYTLIQQALL